MVKGLRELQAHWGGIPDAVRAALRPEMEKIATDIVAMMRRLAPKDQGDLAASINWTWGAAPKGAMTLGAVAPGSDADLQITIYAGGTKKSFHAVFQEFGTRKMTANPFFYPAWRTKRKSARSKITRAINKAIK